MWYYTDNKTERRKLKNPQAFVLTGKASIMVNKKLNCKGQKTEQNFIKIINIAAVGLLKYENKRLLSTINQFWTVFITVLSQIPYWIPKIQKSDISPNKILIPHIFWNYKKIDPLYLQNRKMPLNKFKFKYKIFNKSIGYYERLDMERFCTNSFEMVKTLAIKFF